VEYFADPEDVTWLKERVQKCGKGMVSFLASNMEVRFPFGEEETFLTTEVQGDYESNLADEATNAVTWGIFPGHEITQPTIIERENFLAWKVCSSLSVMFPSHAE